MQLRRTLPLVLVAAAAAACSGHGAVSQGVGGSKGYIEGNLALSYIALGHRHDVPQVSGTTLQGQHFDLAAWRGKVVVVNFWASNCGPCVAEADAFEQVYENDKSRGVEFLGIDVRDDKYQATRFEADHHVGYPSLFDPSNLIALHFRGMPPNATPTTIVLDRAGRITARQSGEIYFTQLRDLVNRVLSERA
jgi:peroxiredoxin